MTLRTSELLPSYCVQVVETVDERTNATKLERRLTPFGNLTAYSIGYKYANQTLFTFLPLILLLVFNSLLVRQVTCSITRRLQLRFDFESTVVRRPFDCLSKVVKVTVT